VCSGQGADFYSGEAPSAKSCVAGFDSICMNCSCVMARVSFSITIKQEMRTNIAHR